jgi:copper transport protein
VRDAAAIGEGSHLKRVTLTTLIALLVPAIFAATAVGHSKLLKSEPRDGQTLKQSPRAVTLTFNEGIEAEFVRLRVEDSSGRSVVRGEPYHPGGREERVAVRLQSDLDGRYVASYRVISADGHPVTKRTSFRVRPPAPPPEEEDEESGMGGVAGESAEQMPPSGREEQDAMGPAPAPEEEHMGEAGPVTDTAFAIARGLGYLAIALAIGAVAFLLVAWLPALAAQAGGGADWRSASERFLRRLRRVAFFAVLLGLIVTPLAIVLEAATAVGVSFTAALDADAIDAVSETRVVEAWSARWLVWLVFGVVLAMLLRPQRAPVLRRAALGATGTALGPGVPRRYLVALLAAVLALALTAPLAGHSGGYSPEALLIGTDVVHVLSMSAWLGGLVMLVLVLPGAARALSPNERTPLLAAATSRFSRMALIAVTLLLLTGIIQSVALINSWEAVYDTGYGRLVLAKVAIFGALNSLGAYNQRRLLPRLRQQALEGTEPGRAASLLRRAVAFEVGFALVVLGVTSVLVVTEPPVGG